MRCLVLLLVALPVRAEEPLGLVAAIERARTHHERAGLAREAVRTAAAEVQQAWAAVRPRLALDAGAAWVGGTGERFVPEGRVGLDTTLGLTAPLFEPRAVPLAERAEILEESVRAQARFEVLELAFAVADAWYGAWVGQRLKEAAERTVNTAQENLEVARARQEVGKALGVDVAQAELRVVQAQEARTQAAHLEASTLDYLGVLVGAEGPLVLAEPSVEPPPTDGVPTDRVQDRPDVRALALAARAARVLVENAWMDFLPSVGAQVFAGVGTTEAFDSSFTTYGAGIGLTWLIYGAERDARHAVEESRARSAALVADLRSREARFSVRQAQRDLVAVTATAQTADQALALARETRLQVLARYRAGRATALELVAAEDSLRQSELARVARTLELHRARLALFRAQGLDPLGKEWVE